MSEIVEHLNSFDQIKIPTIANIPSSVTDPHECILLLHGLTTSKDEYQDVYRNLAAKLEERGKLSVRFDFRGHGDSEAGLAQFNVYNQILDTLSVVNWAQSFLGVEQFTILGTSFGAPPGIFSSSILKEKVNKLVLLAPILDFHRTFISPETEWGHDIFGSIRIFEAVQNDHLKVEQDFVLSRKSALDMMIIDPRPILSMLKCEIAILHGMEDGMVPYNASKNFAEENKQVNFVPMPQTGHGLAQVGDESRTSKRTIDNTNNLILQLIGNDN